MCSAVGATPCNNQVPPPLATLTSLNHDSLYASRAGNLGGNMGSLPVTRERLEAEARSLPREERARLAEALLASLEEEAEINRLGAKRSVAEQPSWMRGRSRPFPRSRSLQRSMRSWRREGRPGRPDPARSAGWARRCLENQPRPTSNPDAAHPHFSRRQSYASVGGGRSRWRSTRISSHDLSPGLQTDGRRRR